MVKFGIKVSGAPGGQIGNRCKWRHLVAKFATNSRSSNYSSYELNTLGPLCLWQCFLKTLLRRNLTLSEAFRELAMFRRLNFSTCVFALFTTTPVFYLLRAVKIYKYLVNLTLLIPVLKLPTNIARIANAVHCHS